MDVNKILNKLKKLKPYGKKTQKKEENKNKQNDNIYKMVSSMYKNNYNLKIDKNL
jgi:hypothetical protein|tara:strand:+ start:1605 stop:1769 length:165 start_codon:yes stop_codon:yes gene_type:complete